MKRKKTSSVISSSSRIFPDKTRLKKEVGDHLRSCWLCNLKTISSKLILEARHPQPHGGQRVQLASEVHRPHKDNRVGPQSQCYEYSWEMMQGPYLHICRFFYVMLYTHGKSICVQQFLIIPIIPTSF